MEDELEEIPDVPEDELDPPLLEEPPPPPPPPLLLQWTRNNMGAANIRGRTFFIRMLHGHTGPGGGEQRVRARPVKRV